MTGLGVPFFAAKIGRRATGSAEATADDALTFPLAPTAVTRK